MQGFVEEPLKVGRRLHRTWPLAVCKLMLIGVIQDKGLSGSIVDQSFDSFLVPALCVVSPLTRCWPISTQRTAIFSCHRVQTGFELPLWCPLRLSDRHGIDTNVLGRGSGRQGRSATVPGCDQDTDAAVAAGGHWHHLWVSRAGAGGLWHANVYSGQDSHLGIRYVCRRCREKQSFAQSRWTGEFATFSHHLSSCCRTWG